MGRYEYAGPGPQEDPDGGLVRPGDVREFDEEPAWGPWEPVPDEAQEAPGATETSAPAPASPGPAAATPAAARPFGTESAPEGE